MQRQHRANPRRPSTSKLQQTELPQRLRDAPASDDGSAVTEYSITSISPQTDRLTYSPSGKTFTVSKLTDQTAYIFSVSATDSAGTTSQSISSNPVIIGVPSIQGVTGVGLTPPPALTVNPVKPPIGYSAKISIIKPCSVSELPSLTNPAATASVDDTGAPLKLTLNAPLQKGDSICAVESYTLGGKPALSPTKSATLLIPAAKTPTELEAEDTAIRTDESVCTKARDAACLAALRDRYTGLRDDVEAAKANNVLPEKGQQYDWSADANRISYAEELIVNKKSKQSALYAGVFALGLGDLTGNVSHLRVIGGIDASAASSTDISARFLLDGSLDIPISAHDRPINSKMWAWADVKLASMASPGAISGASNLPTYVSSLTSATPAGVVQSFEASGGPEIRLHTVPSQLWRRPILISAIGTAGIITPLSPSQASPPIYTAPLNLQQYYVNLGSIPHPPVYYLTNAIAIEKACGWTVPSSGPPAPPSPTATCYVAYVPQGRSSFFRNYAAGFRFKRYYYNDSDERFIFPATADFTIGQNDYVTGGMLRGWVLHVGGSTPIAGLPGVYIYASTDVRVTTRNVSSQQFLLQSAPASVLATDSDAAQISVPQPDRDRYRFGIGFDVAKLYAAITTHPNSSSQNAGASPANSSKQ